MVQKSLKFKKPYIHAAFTKCFTQYSCSGELRYVRIKFKHTFAIMDMLNMKKIYVHF